MNSYTFFNLAYKLLLIMNLPKLPFLTMPLAFGCSSLSPIRNIFFNLLSSYESEKVFERINCRFNPTERKYLTISKFSYKTSMSKKRDHFCQLKGSVEETMTVTDWLND